MSYTPKNNFNLRMIETGVDLPVYTPENNSNLQLKRTGVGDIGFQEKLLANVTCCNALDYRFNFDFNPDYVSVNGGIVINIIEGCADFTWEITGSDFTLDDATTSVRYNIVRAGAGTTVGTTETLTVTDSCNTVIEATIVCCDANVCCDLPGYAFTYSGDDPIELDLDIPYRLTLEGGCPPFLWISNHDNIDFLDPKYTNIPNNYVIASSGGENANGTLTITDDCNTIIEIGYGLPLGLICITGNNNHGQLGLGDETNRNIFTQIGTGLWSHISCGRYFSIAIQDNRSLWSTGHNGYGQLGLGDNTDRDIFIQVGTDSWKQISCGAYHSIAIHIDETLWATGDNNYGELGLGGSSDRDTFTQVGTALWQQVACGGRHSVAIRNDGSLWSTGYNYYGQLGLGDDGNYTDRDTFTRVGTSQWKQVACGFSHTFVIHNNGTLWAMGINNTGQLGLGDGASRNVPTQVGTDLWKQVACGDYHTLAIRDDGTLWVVGNNYEGGLGLGDNTHRNVFTQVGTSQWDYISGGGRHSVIAQDDGTLWVAGSNGSGELGLGDNTNRNIFTQVSGSTPQNRMAADSGYQHSAYLKIAN